MNETDAAAVMAAQREFFASGQTRSLQWRKTALLRLRDAIHAREDLICAALDQDLRRPATEAFASDIGTLLMEINTALRNLDEWAAPARTHTLLATFPSHAELIAEPLGVVLVIAPWNYPIVLALAPVVSAVAAGNCVVVKPSELAPASAQAVAELVADAFAPEHVACVQGGADTAEALLNARWDHIFYTGNGNIARHVAAAAAKHLTPLTLELGGKSPLLVTENADLRHAAFCTVAGKFWNAGQTCIAPDYVLVHERVREPYLQLVKAEIQKAYGANPQNSADYGRIVNARHFRRLLALMDGSPIHSGGEHVAADRYISPTLLDSPAPTSAVMQEEIFGPILPVLAIESLDDGIAFIQARPKPLALYLFSNDAHEQQRVLAACSFGGGCINDTLTHFVPTSMPFGGVGASGYGRYHGKAGFDTFSNRKAVLRRSRLALDWLVRLRPYRNWQLRLLRLFLR